MKMMMKMKVHGTNGSARDCLAIGDSCRFKEELAAFIRQGLGVAYIRKNAREIP
jgi:hypothetical protein